MFCINLITTDKEEISCKVASTTEAILFTTSKNSRFTSCIKYNKHHHDWFCKSSNKRADDFTSHLLDYSVSKWYQDKNKNEEIRHFINCVMANPTDLDEQRQTNSFSGSMWK